MEQEGRDPRDSRQSPVEGSKGAVRSDYLAYWHARGKDVVVLIEEAVRLLWRQHVIEERAILRPFFQCLAVTAPMMKRAEADRFVGRLEKPRLRTVEGDAGHKQGEKFVRLIAGVTLQEQYLPDLGLKTIFEERRALRRRSVGPDCVTVIVEEDHGAFGQKTREVSPKITLSSVRRRPLGPPFVAASSARHHFVSVLDAKSPRSAVLVELVE
jgi:hypothetical protein